MHNAYYDLTVPVFKKMLANIDVLLDKGAAFARETGLSESELLDKRLALDMFPLVKQIQIITDNAKGASARLCGIEIPVMEDTESTVAELRLRIEKTIAFLDSLTPEQFADAEKREVHLKYFPETHFTGDIYLREYALPNFFFHVTVAYAILRSIGVVIGKSDYLGALTLLNN